MNPPRVDIQWRPRNASLQACAAAARGKVAKRLVQRLLRRDDAELARLHGVAAENLLVVTGGQDELPWVDGVAYLGRAPGARDLLVPTTLAPTVPESLLARAVAHARIQPPVAILVDHQTLVTLAPALPLTRALLEHWQDTLP